MEIEVGRKYRLRHELSTSKGVRFLKGEEVVAISKHTFIGSRYPGKKVILIGEPIHLLIEPVRKILFKEKM